MGVIRESIMHSRGRLKLIVLAAVVVPAILMLAQSRPAPAPEGGTSHGQDGHAATAPTSQPARFKVATYNLICGLSDVKDYQAAADNIRASGADVVAIQESNNQLNNFLRNKLKDVYPHWRFYSEPGGAGFAWLSKAPLTNHRLVPRKDGTQEAPLAEAVLGGKAVQLVNIHLHPTTLPPDADLAKAAAALEKAEALRDREIKYFLDNASRKLPLIMPGDYNSFPDQKAPTFLTGKGFVDSYGSVNKDAGETWRGAYAGQAFTFRIDYIFHSPQIRTIKSEVIKKGPSDHYMVVSELEFVPPATAPAATRPAGRTGASN